MTPSQLEDSANAPWTRTIVGCMRLLALGDPSRAWRRSGVQEPRPDSGASRDKTFAEPMYAGALASGDAARVGNSGERAAQLLAGADLELGEHLAQVVLDGARADEQLGADLRVRLPVARHPGDLGLLGREDVAGLHGPPGRGLAGGQQLAACALGERLGADLVEAVVGGAELLARVNAPVLATQPFAVQELGAGVMDHATAALEPLDRLAVERFRIASVAQQRARAGLDAKCPIGAAGPRALAEAIERSGGRGRLVAADAGLDLLGERPPEGPDVLVFARPAGGRKRLGVAAGARVGQCGGPPQDAPPPAPPAPPSARRAAASALA